MINTFCRHADKFVGIGVFENVNAVVGFLTVVQKSDSEVLVFVGGPPISLCIVAMMGSRKQVFIFLNDVVFLVWIEVINFHALTPKSVCVCQRVGAALIEIQRQTIPSQAVLPLPYDEIWKVLTNYAGFRGSQHTLSIFARGRE